jgi:acetyl esterase/lipase
MKGALLLLLVLATSSGCLAYRALSPEPLPEGARVIPNVAYGPLGADPDRHKLDLYLPNGTGPHPVVIFVHGGYWQAGGRQEAFGVYQRLGRRLAARGIAAAIISYRLSPRYRHPVHIEDVALAIASTLNNLDKLGGDPKQVYLVGHSAGGHLVMLAALEPRWLARHGVSRSQIAGVVAISGVYDIEDLAQSYFGAPQVRKVFGRNEDAWRRASPVRLARSSPRLLLAIADRDEPMLIRQHHAMEAALAGAGEKPATIEIANRTHITIIVEMFAEGDPLGEAVEKFIKQPNAARHVP